LWSESDFGSRSSRALAQILVCIGDYAALLIPNLAGHVQVHRHSDTHYLHRHHQRGLRSASIVQNITASLEGAALIGFVALCFLLPAHGLPPAAAVAPPASGWVAVISSGVIAIQAVIQYL